MVDFHRKMLVNYRKMVIFYGDFYGEFHGMRLGIYHLLMTDIAMENPPIYTMAIV
jgi:hypothetical protein